MLKNIKRFIVLVVVVLTSAIACDEASNQTDLLVGVTSYDSNLYDQYEPNNDVSQATLITLDTPIIATIHEASDKDYYSVTLNSSTIYNIGLACPTGFNYDIAIYDSSYTEVASGTLSGNEALTYQPTTQGTFYIKVYPEASSSVSETLEYTLIPTSGISIPTAPVITATDGTSLTVDLSWAC